MLWAYGHYTIFNSFSGLSVINNVNAICLKLYRLAKVLTDDIIYSDEKVKNVSFLKKNKSIFTHRPASSGAGALG